MKSKNIIITGTSRGIGFELVQLFAYQGHNVLALSRNTQPVNKLEIDNVRSLSVDLCELKDYKKVEKFNVLTNLPETVNICTDTSNGSALL